MMNIKDAAIDLRTACDQYQEAYEDAIGNAPAIIWVTYTDGKMVVMCDGSHRRRIMANIEGIVPKTHFDDSVEPKEYGGK